MVSVFWGKFTSVFSDVVIVVACETLTFWEGTDNPSAELGTLFGRIMAAGFGRISRHCSIVLRILGGGGIHLTAATYVRNNSTVNFNLYLHK